MEKYGALVFCMPSLYCILARAADTAVIFRRGPAKQVCLIVWNLKTNKFEQGQWFKGQIYVRKSDLSPDGTKLVYFAAKYSGKIPTWIAVSKPPFLTALVLWPTVGTSNDLSTFETSNLLALSTYRSDSNLEPMEGFTTPRQLRVKHKPWPGYFYKLADHERLVRDGWMVHAGDPVYARKSPEQSKPVVYRKPVLRGTKSSCLQLSATPSGKASYAICDDLGGYVDLKAEWAEVRGKDLLYSQGGKLFCMRLTNNSTQMECEPPVELADFTDMKFQAIESPDHARQW